jgi:DNA-binding protein YbaB
VAVWPSPANPKTNPGACARPPSSIPTATVSPCPHRFRAPDTRGVPFADVPGSVGATTPQAAVRALTSLTWRLPSFDDLEAEADDSDLDDVPEPELPPEWADRPVPPEFATSLKLVEELRVEARRQREAYERFRADLTTLTSTATSADGEVEVTLRGGGEVVRIDIDDSALRHGASRVASLVLGTLHQAQATLAARLAEAAQEVAAPRLNLRDLVRSYLPDDFEKEGHG